MRLAFSACHVCVQGKAAAAEQCVASLANLVSKAKPQLTPRSDLEAGSEAALADKVKQLQQMADKDGGTLDMAYRSLVIETAELEGQVMTSFNSHTSPQILHWNHPGVAVYLVDSDYVS